MVPTTTSAQALTDLVLPELAGRIGTVVGNRFFVDTVAHEFAFPSQDDAGALPPANHEPATKARIIAFIL